jgi:DNA-binding MarR family transcriptional regulator
MSTAPLRALVTLDRLVHEPARFAILAALTACQTTDFQSLQSMAGLTQGNLSRHLQKLEEGGLITIDKGFKGKRTQTWLEITPAGRSAFQDHWKRLEASVTEAKGWQSPTGGRRPGNLPIDTQPHVAAAPAKRPG